MDVPWTANLAHEMILRSSTSEARVAPRRGALVTGFAVNGDDILYLDRATLVDPKVNVRGGVPLLFPNAGPLSEGLFTIKGTHLSQHGFARRYPWEIDAQSENAIGLYLPLTPDIQAVYPYDFALRYDVTLTARTLRMTLTIANRGQESLPVAPGWHPYFAVPHDHKAHIYSALLGPTWARITDEEEFVFAVPFDAPCDITLPDKPKIWLRASPEHRILQMWSLPGKDFICFEPFAGPNDALNHQDQRLNLAPGEAKSIWIEIGVEG
jgi:galactose mutarotase-like enzyme